MWKLLPVLILASCAVNDRQPAAGGDQAAQGRIVRQAELPTASAVEGRTAKKTFQRQGMQGWLDAAGAWQLRTEVHHQRLRCATYETGIQLGRGNPACSAVEWLTGIEYTTRLRHCNSATRLHAGSGQFPAMANRLQEVSCVRVVIRCEGTC